MSAASSSTQDAVWMDNSLRIEGAADGPLKGLTCAIKDLYDVRVHPDGPTQMWGLAMCSCISNLHCDHLPAYRQGIV